MRFNISTSMLLQVLKALTVESISKDIITIIAKGQRVYLNTETFTGEIKLQIISNGCATISISELLKAVDSFKKEEYLFFETNNDFLVIENIKGVSKYLKIPKKSVLTEIVNLNKEQILFNITNKELKIIINKISYAADKRLYSFYSNRIYFHSYDKILCAVATN